MYTHQAEKPGTPTEMSITMPPSLQLWEKGREEKPPQGPGANLGGTTEHLDRSRKPEVTQGWPFIHSNINQVSTQVIQNGDTEIDKP